MVEVELSRIIIDEEKQEQVIVLKEKGGGRTLPIVVGITEAASIRIKLGGHISPRPMTHDLMQGMLAALGAGIDKVVIDKLLDSTFYATIYLRTHDGLIKQLDGRPSDGVAIAVRTRSPVFVEEAIFQRLAGI